MKPMYYCLARGNKSQCLNIRENLLSYQNYNFGGLKAKVKFYCLSKFRILILNMKLSLKQVKKV